MKGKIFFCNAFRVYHWTHNLLIASLNVRSLTSSFEAIKDYILMQIFDIIGLTETWLKPNIASNNVQIPGFHLFRSDRFAMFSTKRIQ